MSNALRIAPLADLPADIDTLCAEAAAEGFRFVDRLAADWRSGANRFDGPGEVFLGAFHGDRTVGFGGLGRDPYADQAGVGRLRHLYVVSSERRSGVGSALARRLIGHAQGAFHTVRLRTEAQAAADFYVSLGFRPVAQPAATHVLAVLGQALII